jgi:hypothetical protein
MSDWITIPNWDQFQHYNYRRPLWIKNYTSLLRKDEYLDLPLAARGLLHGIWLAYADREGRLRRADLPATLLGRARDAHLASLNHAGLIAFCASRPLSLSLKEEDRPAEKPAVDLRLAAAPKQERLRGQLLANAERIAREWNGGGSDRLAEELDSLERDFQMRLPELERERLWDVAFTDHGQTRP